MDVLQIGIGNVLPRCAKNLFVARRYHDQDDTVPPDATALRRTPRNREPVERRSALPWQPSRNPGLRAERTSNSSDASPRRQDVSRMLSQPRSSRIPLRSLWAVETPRQRQTCCQRQFPERPQTCACQHSDVPIGGIVGGSIGASDGNVIGQMAGGHIGGMSMALPHSGCILPSTHRHVQAASAAELSMSNASSAP